VAAFPGAQIESAASAIDKLVWTKSESEVKQLRMNAAFSAEALRRGIYAIIPGLMQRQAEGEVVSGCLQAGAEGPSFWPWVMTGPNAHIQTVVRSFYDDAHLNRPFQDGELVRVDVGCTSGGYGGDVGRTVPVSGRFTEDQRMTWDALIAGYLAGLKAMKAGQSLAQIEDAARLGMWNWAEERPELQDLIRLLASEAGVQWHIHGVGIESGETAEPELAAGSVIAFEPMFSDETDAYYLEDMILITETGYEVLTTGLPYWSEDMHVFLSDAR